MRGDDIVDIEIENVWAFEGVARSLVLWPATGWN
jgi:hypothetical protein